MITISVEDRQGIRIVKFNHPDRSVNVIDELFVSEMNKALDKIEAVHGLKGVVFASGKTDSFLAGADLNVVRECESYDEAYHISEMAQKLIGRIEALKIPTVAAIDGSCAGGGLELALGCDWRILSDRRETVLGLPEVRLGILPGGGGTQRLPRLVGLQESLKMLLTGKLVPADEAKRVGLADDTVHPKILMSVAIEKASEKRKDAPREEGLARYRNFLTEENRMSRTVIFEVARRRSRAKTKGHYPAPEAILDCVSTGLSKGLEEGLRAEREAFGRLATSDQSRNLVWLFFADKEIERENRNRKSGIEVHRVGVVGAGLMGTGISYVCAAKAGSRVRLKDINEESLGKSLASLARIFDRDVEGRKTSRFEADRDFRRITPTVSGRGLEHADLVIEAVDENKSLKKEILRDLEKEGKPELVLATNTSTIPIAELAKDLSRPSRLVGMHYFSPVEKMRLLEVVRGPESQEEAVNAAVRYGMKQGKRVIVVADSCGFFTSRVLGFYLAEAMRMLSESCRMELIDEALVAAGFPMGPFILMDHVGIKVLRDVGKIMSAHYPARFALPAGLDGMLKEGFTGRRAGVGFYDYSGASPRPNRELHKCFKLKKGQVIPENEISFRCMAQFCLEAAHCLEEGVISSPGDGDYASVYGLGFPAFHAGPFHYLDRFGCAAFLDDVGKYKESEPGVFRVPQLLKKMAKQKQRFYEAAELSGKMIAA